MDTRDWEQEIEDVVEQSAFGETQRAGRVYRKVFSLRIGKIARDRQRTINLFEQQDAGEIVRESQRRERPFEIREFFHVGRNAVVVSDDERQTARIRSHVLLQKFGELCRGPGFPFRVEHNNAIGRIECGG